MCKGIIRFSERSGLVCPIAGGPVCLGQRSRFSGATRMISLRQGLRPDIDGILYLRLTKRGGSCPALWAGLFTSGTRFMEEEIIGRIERFRHELATENIDGALLVQNMDLYYFSGSFQAAHLWLPVSEPPLLMVKEETAQPQKDLAVGKIVPINDLSRIPELIKQHTGRIPKRLGLEMDILPTAHYLDLQKAFPDSELVDVSSLIFSVRMIKSDYEISCITKAAKVADNLFEKMPSFLGNTWVSVAHGH